MTIHGEHPFLPPPQDRDQGRRLRARLGGTVTLWTSGVGAGRGGRTGLTVSSLILADGPTWQVLALLDPDSDLCDRLVATTTAVVQFLTPHHELLAQAFAGQVPAPGGPFTLEAWQDTDWGPRADGVDTWAGVRLVGDPEPVGYGMLVRAVLEFVEVGAGPYLTHHAGRYGQSEY